jgi:hypothetical protein
MVGDWSHFKTSGQCFGSASVYMEFRIGLNLTVKKQVKFFGSKLPYLSLGLREGRRSYMRRIQASKERRASSTSLFYFFVGHFCPTAAGSKLVQTKTTLLYTLFSFLAFWLVIPERIVRWSGNQIEYFLDALVLRVCLVQLFVALHLHKKKE